jgi:tRNA1Val (adenine37-N6)-methyltransferase
MSNQGFSFKQFTVMHNQCAMKVGTDGVLLGAWAGIEGCRRILDVGTGTGLIAIMCAQRSHAYIDAVEIEENAYQQAMENIASCPWKDRITSIHSSFHNFVRNAPAVYELLVCNPPYFRNSLKSPSLERTIARHNQQLTCESLLFYGKGMLAAGGRIALIIPAGDVEPLIQFGYFHELFPQRQTFVRPHQEKSFSRCMIEFSGDRHVVCHPGDIVIKDKYTDDYTDNFKELTRDFYLTF